MPESTRRRFYLTAMYGLWTIMGVAMAGPALVYLFLPPKPRNKEEWVEAGTVTQIAPGSPVEMSFHQERTDGWQVTKVKRTAWVVDLPQQGIVAFGPQCTHLGCAYHWEGDKQEFICPCHTSYFAIDGKVISGPAPRPLDRYETKVQDGKLFLGKLREQA